MARLSRRRGSLKFPPVMPIPVETRDGTVEEHFEEADLEVVVGAEPGNIRAIDPVKARPAKAKRKAVKRGKKGQIRGR